MANNENVQIRITGTIGSSALAQPRVTPKSEVPQYQVNLQNPSFDDNNLQDPNVVNAIKQLELRVLQPTAQYPNPSIFVGLPEHNKNDSKENRVRFYDNVTKTEKRITQEPAIGQQVEAYVDTYHTDNPLAAKYGSRAARLLYIVFPDYNKVQWFTPSSQGLAGFASLDDQGNNGVQPTAPQTPPAPQFNSNTQAASPFTNGQTTAQAAPQNSFTQPSTVQPTETNPLLGGRQSTNSGPFAGRQAAPTAPQAGAFGGQAAQAAPTGQPGQAAPQANPFGGQAAQAGQAAPTGQPAQNNPFAGQQAAPTAPNAQANPQDPFAGTGDTVNISDEDLPF